MFDDSERWLPVVGYEGSYEVSSAGRVRSVDRISPFSDGRAARYEGQELKLHTDACGYPEAVLSKYSKGKTVGVHILVCEAFHGPRPDGLVVRHLNGIPADNRPGNLAWGTRAENMQDKKRHGTDYWSNRTHCKWKHEFTFENTAWERNGTKRRCRACGRIRAAATKQRREARGMNRDAA